jgi:hypothetical protein
MFTVEDGFWFRMFYPKNIMYHMFMMEHSFWWLKFELEDKFFPNGGDWCMSLLEKINICVVSYISSFSIYDFFFYLVLLCFYCFLFNGNSFPLLFFYLVFLGFSSFFYTKDCNSLLTMRLGWIKIEYFMCPSIVMVFIVFNDSDLEKALLPCRHSLLCQLSRGFCSEKLLSFKNYSIYDLEFYAIV